MTRFRMAAAALVALSVHAKADDLIFLTGGRVYQGTVLESSWDWIKVKATVDGAQETHTVAADEFDPHFFYVVRDKALGDDAAERIKLAKYCVEHEMYARAKVQMDKARAAEPKLVEEFMENEFPKMRNGLAQRLLDAGQRALRRGSTKNAKKYASWILTRFEGTPAEAGAEALLEEVQKKIDEEEAAKRKQRRHMAEEDAERAERELQDKRDAILGPIEKNMDMAARANHEGLRAKNMSDTRNHFESAAGRYEAVVSHAKKAMAAAPDEETKKALAEMEAQARDGAVQAYLNLANALSARGSYKEAVDYCNKALEIDPANAEAKQARLTMSTTTSGWDHRRGGRRGGRR